VAVAVGQFHNLGTCPFKSSTLEPSTQEQLREEGRVEAWCWGNRSDLPVQRMLLQCGAKRESSAYLVQRNKKAPL
jgi:hypothetical protein